MGNWWQRFGRRNDDESTDKRDGTRQRDGSSPPLASDGAAAGQLMALLRQLGEHSGDPARQVDLCRQILGIDERPHALPPVARSLVLGTQGEAMQALAKTRGGTEARDLLTGAVGCFERMLQVSPRAAMWQEWAAAQMSKGNALQELALTQAGAERRTSLQEAIHCYDAALLEFRRDAAPSRWALVQTNKGVALHELSLLQNAAERQATLIAAIACHDAALLERQREVVPQEWAATQNNKATALQELAGLRTGTEQRETLAAAVACYVAALGVYRREVDPRNWAMAQSNMGVALHQLAHVSSGADRRITLERAIACFDLALQERTRAVAPRAWAMTQLDKGGAQIDLGLVLAGDEQREAWQAAVRCCDAALDEWTRETSPLHWADAQLNKGTALHALALRMPDSGQRTLLRASIACFDAALSERRREVTPLGWAEAENNKGNALRNLAAVVPASERPATLRAAIACFERALLEWRRDVVPLQWADTLENQGRTLVALAAMSAGADRREASEVAAACFDAAVAEYPPAVLPAKHRTCALLSAQTHLELAVVGNRSGADALDPTVDLAALDRARAAAQSGLEAARLLERLAPTLEFRQEEWASNAALYSVAAAIQALRGAPEAAADLLEAGRARGLSEALGRQRADLDLLGADDRAEYTAAVDAVLEIEARGRSNMQPATALVGESVTATARLEDVVKRLRKTYPRFLPERKTDIRAIAAKLRPNEALIYLAPQTTGTLILIVPPGDAGARSKWIGSLSADDIFTLAVQPDEEGLDRLGYLYAACGRGATPLDEALDTLLPALGERLMRHVTALAREHSARRIVLVAGGILAVLPLHAASYAPLVPEDTPTAPGGRRYACDDLTILWAPSGGVYASLGDVARTLNDTGGPQHGFVVGNPQLTAAGMAWESGMAGYLPNARFEATDVATWMKLAGMEVVTKVDADATREAVVVGLNTARVAHFAMHAVFDESDPLSSALLVAPGARLYLRELLDSRMMDLTHLRLVVLSACQSGLTDFRRLREEAVGLFGALLGAGAMGVICSLWPVYDTSTRRLMRETMRRYLIEGQEPEFALRNAQRQMRGLGDDVAAEEAAGGTVRTTPPARPPMYGVTQGHAAAAGREHEPESEESRMVWSGYRGLDGTGEELVAAQLRTSWAHPIHWAAFVYYGV